MVKAVPPPKPRVLHFPKQVSAFPAMKVRMVVVMVVRMVTTLIVMVMLLISAKPSLSTYYVQSKFVNSLYPHHKPGR